MSLAKDELFAYEPLTISNEAIEAELADISLAKDELFEYEPLTASREAIEEEFVDMSLAKDELFAYEPLTASREAIEEELSKILLAKEALPSTFDNSIYEAVEAEPVMFPDRLPSTKRLALIVTSPVISLSISILPVNFGSNIFML